MILTKQVLEKVFVIFMDFAQSVADPTREGRGQELFSDENAGIVKQCSASEASICVAGGLGLLKGPRSSRVFDAQICILPHSRDFFSHF